MVVREDHQRQAVVVVEASVFVLFLLVQAAQRGVDAAGTKCAVVSGAEDAVLVVGVEEGLRVGTALELFEVGLVGGDEGAVEGSVRDGIPADGGCLGCGAGNAGATPSPTLPRCASLRGRGRFGGCFGNGGMRANPTPVPSPTGGGGLLAGG